MKTTRIFPHLAAAAMIAASSAQAAVININDYSLVPNGLNESTTFQNTDVDPNLLNPAANGTVFYVVTTFSFGTLSDAHLQWQFSTADTAANRMGVEVQDTGLVQSISTGNGVLQAVSDTTPKRTTVNLNQDMAGLSITLLAKFYYNTAVSSDLDARTALNGALSTSDDTIMNVWINPTLSDVEGDTSSHAAMIGNGDMYAVWNSTSFNWFRQTIQNQNTPVDNTGASSITNTTILTGDNATFANALALAVPEPSAALLGGLGLLALLRRRRNA
jgi:hypothetical protein